MKNKMNKSFCILFIMLLITNSIYRPVYAMDNELVIEKQQDDKESIQVIEKVDEILDENADDKQSDITQDDNIQETETVDDEKELKSINVQIKEITSSTVTITWEESENNGEKSYQIYRDGKLIGETSELIYLDEQLEAQTNYIYIIKAIDKEGNELELSEKLEIITEEQEKDIEKPTIPMNIQTEEITSSNVKIIWDASTDNTRVECYKIYRNKELVAETKELTYADEELEAETNYKYNIKAIDEAGNESELSDDLLITTEKEVVKITVVPLNINASNVTHSEIALTWQKSLDESNVEFEVYRDDELIITTSDLKFVDRNLDANTTYVYSVKVKSREDSLADEGLSLEVTTLNNSKGDGTSQNPYKISTKEELKDIKNNLDCHYILVSDINLEGEEWEPIGKGKQPFEGSFDGAGHTINNVVISEENVDENGFFGYINGAIIKNVKLREVNITGKNAVGGLVGRSIGGELRNNSVKGEITSTGYPTGLLVGSNESTHIELCDTEGIIKGAKGGVKAG
ncbi:MAG: hypothetical protein N4A50_11765, partial [Vallitalea sp.]|nr:hypothetical protein [Vallitalea sp.]